MPTERTDPSAAVHVTNELHRLVADRTFTDSSGALAAFDETDSRDIAETIAGHYIVIWEQKNGLRRPVLLGAWEVDPHQVAANRRETAHASAGRPAA